MAEKKKKSGEMLKYLRDASTTIKKSIEDKQQAAETSAPVIIREPFKPKIFNIIDYIESGWGLGMTLYPAQKVIVKTYYGLELDNTTKSVQITDMFNEKVLYNFTEVEYLRYMYNEGKCNIGEIDHVRNELILSIGRRAGKTTLSSIFASYELYRLLNLNNPQGYYGFPNGNSIQIVSLGTDKEQAQLLFNEVTTHLAKCDYFRRHIVSNTQSQIKMRTPYELEKYGEVTQHQNGKFVSFNGKASLRVSFKGANGKGLRGYSNAVVILDEMAHYLETGESSATKVYNAVTPSTATFVPKDPETHRAWKRPDGTEYPLESRIIAISSPLNKSGKFYEMFQMAMSNGPGSKNMLAFKAPTWEINPTVPSDYYRQRFHADPKVFMVEHGAEFSDQVRGWITRSEDLTNCINLELRPTSKGTPRVPHFLGLDIGLVGDSSSMCLTTVDPVTGKIRLVYHEMWTAGEDWRDTNKHLSSSDMPLPYCAGLKSVDQIEFNQLALWVEAISKKFYIQEGVFDGWMGIPLDQNLKERGMRNINLVNFSPTLKSHIYQAAMLMLLDRKVEIYDWPREEDATGKTIKHSPQIQEFLKLQAEQRANNIVIVSAPPGVDNHDDWSDSFVRSIWLAIEHLSKQKGSARPGGVAMNPYSRAPVDSITYERRKERSRRGAYINQRPSKPFRR